MNTDTRPRPMRAIYRDLFYNLKYSALPLAILFAAIGWFTGW